MVYEEEEHYEVAHFSTEDHTVKKRKKKQFQCMPTPPGCLFKGTDP